MSEEQVNKIYKVTPGAIHGFFKEHRFLSNFHECFIEWEGLKYTSTEAAYHAAKCVDLSDREMFLGATPSQSKHIGRKVKLREDWEQIKDNIMFQINAIKYTAHKDLRALLLETGDKELVEDNWWGDTYWGRVNGDGANKLGVVLMSIRNRIKFLDELRKFDRDGEAVKAEGERLLGVLLTNSQEPISSIL